MQHTAAAAKDTFFVIYLLLIDRITLQHVDFA